MCSPHLVRKRPGKMVSPMQDGYRRGAESTMVLLMLAGL